MYISQQEQKLISKPTQRFCKGTRKIYKNWEKWKENENKKKMEVIKKVNEKMVKNETRKHALKTGWWVAVEKGGVR